MGNKREKGRWLDAVRSTQNQKSATYSCHLKSYIVDDMAWYIGSENLYPAPLGEFGVIIDDKEITDEVLNKFWEKVWEESSDDYMEYKKCIQHMQKFSENDQRKLRI